MKSPLLNRRNGEGAGLAPKEDQGDDAYPRDGNSRRSLCPRREGARERGKCLTAARPTPGGPSGLGVRPLSLLGLPFPGLPSLSRVDLRAPLWAPCIAPDPPAALSRLPPLGGQLL